jgi:NAD(P)-dependent dehydrogenase (short-subunit alcohol dehydrogenase family)
MSDNYVAIVTGASSGIGAATARGFAEAGYQVYGGSRSSDADLPPGVRPLTIDVDDDASVQEAVDRVHGEVGRIDVLVNAAGYLCAGGVEETTLADARRQFETNYFGVVRMTLAALPGMREQRSGHIITISSLAGLVPVPFWGHYNASKFAVEGLMETLRHEVRPFGIQVALVEPGNIKTAFYARPQAAGMSEYAGARERAFAVMGDFEVKAPGPEIVARKVLGIARDAHPRLRNKVTREATQFTALRRLLPAGAFETGIRRAFKLAGEPS